MIRTPDLRRLALIGDSVFAVSITLNARAVAVPVLDRDVGWSQALVGFVSGMGAVLLSVVVASVFWMGHWRYFRDVRRSGSALLAAHFLFLLVLILMPMSTEFYAANLRHPIATLVYSINLLAMTLVALVFRFVAIRHTPDRVVEREDWVGLVVVIGLFAVSVALSLPHPRVAQSCWMVALASPLVEGWLGRRAARRRAADDAGS